jgi:hypothetical protein
VSAALIALFVRREDRVSVRRRAYDRFGADITGGTRPVLDDEGLARSPSAIAPSGAR